MILNTLAIMVILFVFILIGTVLFSLRKPVLLKMLKPLIEVLDWLYSPVLVAQERQKFRNILDEKNKQYHQKFIKSVGVKSSNLP